jgi:hypothetical protein
MMGGGWDARGGSRLRRAGGGELRPYIHLWLTKQNPRVGEELVSSQGEGGGSSARGGELRPYRPGLR